MCENTKVATAAAELKRRWKNSSQYIRKSKFEQITREYMEMLDASGYSMEWRERVLLGAIKGYARVLSTCSQEDLPRNRPG